MHRAGHPIGPRWPPLGRSVQHSSPPALPVMGGAGGKGCGQGLGGLGGWGRGQVEAWGEFSRGEFAQALQLAETGLGGGTVPCGLGGWAGRAAAAVGGLRAPQDLPETGFRGRGRGPAGVRALLGAPVVPPPGVTPAASLQPLGGGRPPPHAPTFTPSAWRCGRRGRASSGLGCASVLVHFVHFKATPHTAVPDSVTF